VSSPNITVHVKGGTTKVVTAPRLQVSGGGSSSNSFGVVNVATQNNITAVIPTDTLHVEAGTGILLTTNSVTSTLTIVATGGSATDQFARDQANSAFTKANTANVTGQAAFNHANSAYSNANTAIYTASQIRANISNTAPVNYDPSTGIISHALSGVVATTYGNTTFVPTITVDDKGHITSVTNTAIALPPSTDEFARAQANAAFNQANTANVTGQAAFDKANSGFTLATTANTVAASAYNQANIATTNADAAFARANGAIYTAAQIRSNISNTAPINYDATTGIISHTSSGVVATGHGDAATVPKVVVDQYGHITGVTNTSIAISAAAVISGTLAIARGGTGQTAITVNGSVLIGNTVSGGYDVNALTQGTGISITNDKGSITIAATGGSAIDQYARDKANGAVQTAFPTINVAGQSDIVADSNTDTLTIVAGTGIALTTDAATDTLTITATGGSSTDQFARDHANAAFDKANAANNLAQSGFNQANTANVTGQAAFAKANTAIYTAAQIRANISNTTPILYDPSTGIISLTTVPVTLGGTGYTSYSNGDLLIGNTMSGGLDRANLTQGYGIVITNANGKITLDSVMGKTYYLVLSQASDAASYNVASVAPSANAEVNTSVVYTGTSYSLAASFITAPGEPGTTLLPAGTYGRHVHATTDGASNEGQLRVDLYKYAANTLETLLRSNESPIFTSNDADALLLNWNITDPVSYALEETDRLLFKVYARRVSGGSGSVRVTVFYEGTSRATYIPTTILTVGADAFARLQANAAYNHANGAYNKANVATTNADAAFAQANAAYANANTAIYTAAQIRANISASLPISYSSATGIISLPATANGQTLIGNTVSGAFDVATIAQTAPVIVTNGKGTVTLSHASSGVTAAVYGNGSIIPSITIDAFGHITGAVNTAVAIDASQVTSGTLAVARGGTGQSSYTNGQILIGNTGSTGLDKATIAQSAPVIVTVAQGLITLSHARSGVTAVDSYGSAAIVPVFAVDANGHLTAVVNTSIAISAAAVTSGILTVARGGTGKDATGLANGQLLIGNTVNTGFDLTTIAQTAPVIVVNGKGTITLSHASSTVAPAVYGGSNRVIGYTVDTFGHLTTATNVAIDLLDAGVITTGTLVVVRGGTGQSAYTNGQILIGNTGSTGLDKSTIAQTFPIIVTNTQGLINLSHASSGVTLGTYGGSNRVIGYTVDTFGHLTTASNVAIDLLPAAAITTGIISVARGGTGKDATGLVNGQILIGNTVNTGFDLAAITQTAPVIVSTDKGSIRLSHARSGVTAATYGSASLIPVITVDDNGHITVATTAAASGLPVAAANGQLLVGNTVSSSFDVYTPAQSAPIIVTVGKGTITYSHARSGVVALDSYGSGAIIPVLAIDANGHITAAVNTAVAISAAAITSGTLVQGRGGTGFTGASANGQTLIGNTVSGGFDLATLTAGTGININNLMGSIEIVATGGSATDQFARDTANGAFTKANGAVQTGFVTIVVAGQSDVVADSNTDTLTLVAGTNMTITTDAGTDTITLAAASGGGVTLGLSVAVASGYCMP